jgi:hypothetical protein
VPAAARRRTGRRRKWGRCSGSPQFTFTAPTPWLFGATGGTGTSVADGYYLYLEPMGVGQHVLHYTGGFHFEAGVFGPEPFDITADQTYVINVTP